MAAQPRRIMVGFDGSEAAWRALETAAQLTGYGSSLTVVSVTDEDGADAGVLDAARERVHERQVTAAYVQRVGDPAEELLHAARELGAELVVVGRRSTVDNSAAPGSVSAAVVRRAPCDVLVIT